jgi:hypothetical protein
MRRRKKGSKKERKRERRLPNRSGSIVNIALGRDEQRVFASTEYELVLTMGSKIRKDAKEG